MAIRGVDVSKHQGAVDWPKVAGAGTRFAVVRASYGDTPDDEWYLTNIAGARKAGLVVGHYHYAYPSSTADAAVEARHFADRIRASGVDATAAGTLPPFLDLETTGGLGGDVLAAWAETFMAEVTRLTGRVCGLYTYPAFIRQHLGGSAGLAALTAGRMFWLAHYGVSEPAYQCDIWQYTSTGSVPGISGDCDLNYWRGSDEGFAAATRGDDMDAADVWDHPMKIGDGKTYSTGSWLKYGNAKAEQARDEAKAARADIAALAAKVDALAVGDIDVDALAEAVAVKLAARMQA